MARKPSHTGLILGRVGCRRSINAPSPQDMAVSLKLTVRFPRWILRLRLRRLGRKIKSQQNGEPKAHHDVPALEAQVGQPAMQ